MHNVINNYVIDIISSFEELAPHGPKKSYSVLLRYGTTAQILTLHSTQEALSIDKSYDVCYDVYPDSLQLDEGAIEYFIELFDLWLQSIEFFMYFMDIIVALFFLNTNNFHKFTTVRRTLTKHELNR